MHNIYRNIEIIYLNVYVYIYSSKKKKKKNKKYDCQYYY